MRLRVIADVHSARAQQGERLIEQDMLACAAVSEDEIEGIRQLAPYRRPGRAVAFMPSSNQQVPTPVPVPISSSLPPGFKAAMTRSKAPTGGQHQFWKPVARVSAMTASSSFGGG